MFPTVFLSGFTANDFQTNQGGDNGVKYIKPQTASICKLAIGYQESSQKGTPAIVLTFTNETGETNTNTLYITEGGFNITKQTVARIAEHANLKEALISYTNKTFATAQDWVNCVAGVLDNAQVGVAFKGEEYVNSNSEVKTKAVMWYTFTATPEAVDAAVKYIAANPDKAVKRLPTQATTDTFTPGINVNAIDPFASNPLANATTGVAVADGVVRDAQGNVLF